MKRITLTILVIAAFAMGQSSNGWAQSGSSQVAPGALNAANGGPLQIPSQSFPWPIQSNVPNSLQASGTPTPATGNYSFGPSSSVQSSAPVGTGATSSCQSCGDGQFSSGEFVQGDFAGQENFIDGQFVDQGFGDVGGGRGIAAGIGNLANGGGRNVHSTIGVSGLIFGRNFGNNATFAQNAAGDFLVSENVTRPSTGGFDVNYARRRANGRGWEARYFGLFPEDVSGQVDGGSFTTVFGLTQIGPRVSGIGTSAVLNGPSAADIFNVADTHVLTRQFDLNNLEFNILRRRRPRFGATSAEFLAGFRYFQFGETLLYQAVNLPEGDPASPNPSTASLFNSVENSFTGFQIGGRSDYQLRSRWGFHVGVKGGIYNNRIQTLQRVEFVDRNTGAITTPNIAGGELGGQPFDVGASNDVVAFLGELDLGLSYQFSGRARVRAGYRGIAATNIGFASNQFANDFTNLVDLQTANTDGSLILHGGYFGFELAY